MKNVATAALILLALTLPVFAQSKMEGSYTLGTPVAIGNGLYNVPVIVTVTPDSAPPQAFCFRINTSSPVTSLNVIHDGISQGVTSVFEWQGSNAPQSYNYLVVYDGRTTPIPVGVPVTVASLVVYLSNSLAPVSITFDPSSLTMISNQGGTVSATQDKGTLTATGTTIDPVNGTTTTPPVVIVPPVTTQPAPTRRHTAGH